MILRSKSRGDYLKERKKPGPHPEKPLEHDLKVRVDNETLAKVEFCMKKLSMTRSEVLRQSLSQVKKASKAVIQAESRREGAKNGVTKQSSAAERRIKFLRFQFFRKLFFFDTE